MQQWEILVSISVSTSFSLVNKNLLKHISNIALSIEVFWIWFQILFMCLIVKHLCILAIIHIHIIYIEDNLKNVLI